MTVSQFKSNSNFKWDLIFESHVLHRKKFFTGAHDAHLAIMEMVEEWNARIAWSLMIQLR